MKQFMVNADENGNLSDDDKKTLRDYFRKAKGGRYLITVDRFSGRRSVKQNRLERLWLGIIASELGVTPEYLHNRIKIECYGIDNTDKIVYEGHTYYIPTSHDKSKIDFKALLNRLEEIANDYEPPIVLPYPDNFGEWK